jgi:hypothetical protein
VIPVRARLRPIMKNRLKINDETKSKRILL